MSLASAVNEVVEQLMGDAETFSDPLAKTVVLLRCQQLRTAVKASEGHWQKAPVTGAFTHKEQELLSQAVQKQQQRRREQEALDAEETTMRKLVGGTFDGDYVTCSVGLLAGHTTHMSGQRYVLKDDGYFHRED